MFEFYRRMGKASRRLLLICFYAFFCNGTLSLLVGSVMPDLKAAYGLSDTVSGLFMSAHSTGNLIAGFISGLVPLWLGRKRGVMVMSTLAFLGYIMVLLWGAPGWLFIAFLFVGLGRGSVTNFNSRMVNLLTGGSSAANNLLHGVFAIGAIVLPMVFLVLRNAISWQAGVCFVIVLGVFEELLWSRMKLEDDHPQRSDRKNSTLVFMKDPAYLVLALMMFCYLCAEYTLNGWLVTYIQSKESLTAALAASGTSMTAFSQSMAALFWVVMLIGRLVCATLSSRFSQKKMMAVCSVGMCAGFFYLTNASTVTQVTIAVSVLGGLMAGICPMIYSDAAWYTNTYPMATSMLLGIGSIGAIAMPTIVGSLADRFGFDAGMDVILAVDVLLVVFSVLNVFIRTKRPE